MAVVIGRNEGERLRRCLQSVVRQGCPMVYVDSGSVDGSAELARTLGAQVVELDPAQAFTAARARNEGWQLALQQWPAAAFVQFVDGDCEVRENWIATAHAHLLAHPDVAVVCGRRRERHPESSKYNQLCDLEWGVPPGEARAFGGDAMVRAQALRETGGYNPALIAGEEPEWSVRLRQSGWKIQILSAEMTWHDADMHRFWQWWQRSKRAGYAYAEGVAMHGAPPERHGVRELRRAVGWGLLLPAVVLVSVVSGGTWAAALLLLYPLQWARLALARNSPRRWLWSLFNTLGKFAEAQGALRYWILRLRRQHGRLIEYK
ncbi:glycosyltransferase family A protein [Ideonella sp. B508-1]|uniref:glycosyltransferase family A protein n=1 Tax=Ideonella sp. B508-1 TaxID=137716 RepID=UPI0003B6D336|nr:glycosyltransferase family A protein [Ideonella sp. B508-1]